jgi:hypothetical protein
MHNENEGLCGNSFLNNQNRPKIIGYSYRNVPIINIYHYSAKDCSQFLHHQPLFHYIKRIQTKGKNRLKNEKVDKLILVFNLI